MDKSLYINHDERILERSDLIEPIESEDSFTNSQINWNPELSLSQENLFTIIEQPTKKRPFLTRSPIFFNSTGNDIIDFIQGLPEGFLDDIYDKYHKK